jgi:hypothetical protein
MRQIIVPMGWVSWLLGVVLLCCAWNAGRTGHWSLSVQMRTNLFCVSPCHGGIHVIRMRHPQEAPVRLDFSGIRWFPQSYLPIKLPVRWFTFRMTGPDFGEKNGYSIAANYGPGFGGFLWWTADCWGYRTHWGRLTIIGVPLWLLSSIWAIPPGMLCARAARCVCRARNGLCTKCAYDLRASPDRCPECGTAVPPQRGTKRGRG